MKKPESTKVYLGTFLIAFSTLALEIVLTRLLSVSTWYFLAFFVISTALLGMSAGAVTVYLKPNWFIKEKLNKNIAKSCLGYALVIPFTLIILCVIPVPSEINILLIIGLLIRTIACMMPFYFAGIVITAVLTKHTLPIGKLYASDLSGASLGCWFILGGLEIFDAPSLILLCSPIAVLAALSFTWRCSVLKLRRISTLVFVIFILLVIINSSTPYSIRPLVVKGIWVGDQEYILDEWNSYSRVTVYQLSEGKPFYWSASPQAPKEKKVFRYWMQIDGEAATTLNRYSSQEDIDFLRFDVVNVGYYIRPNGTACIIGVGGGRDIQSAILFGHKKITGIDINPIFINLLQGQFREFTGIADNENVKLVVDEARSYLSRTEEKYSVIQMSLIDTWAATGAGAYSLSENALYTVECWKIFFSRLADDGIFTVSRWYNPSNLGETGRLISLASATLFEAGITNTTAHIALVDAKPIATLILSKQPFSKQDITKLQETVSDLEYNLPILPGVPPTNEILNNIISANSLEELNAAIAEEPYNFQPPTDENPYFFNMLRLDHINDVVYSDYSVGVGAGNLYATLSLVGLIIILFLVAIFTIVFPLVLVNRRKKLKVKTEPILWSGAAYFSLIGAGFMFTEIALIQRLSVFLGHPVYALGILLFSIIASAGIGSFLSERLPLQRIPWIYIYPMIIALTIIIIRFVLPVLGANMVSSLMTTKILASVLIIVPLGILLGVCFPTGMRLVKSAKTSETPWYWALNGMFSVLCSAMAVFISIFFGISTSFYIAATCYIMLLIFLPKMYNANRNTSVHSTVDKD